MIRLVEFDNINFLKDNPNYIKRIYDHRYKDTNYAIIQEGKNTWVIYVIDDNLGIFELFEGYWTKKKAIEEIESGNFKRKMFERKILYDKIVEVL